MKWVQNKHSRMTLTKKRIKDSPKHLKIESLATIINGYKPLTVVAKLSILNICESSEYTSECITY